MRESKSAVLWYSGHEQMFVAERAEGCYVHDCDGRRYIDLESGVWCTVLGHSHPGVLRVLTEQAARIGHTGFNYTTDIVGRAAQQVLASLSLDGGRCVFLCSGSEAVEYGVRVAHSLADRPLLMTMSDSYFGAYGSASEKRCEGWFCFDWSPCGQTRLFQLRSGTVSAQDLEHLQDQDQHDRPADGDQPAGHRTVGR